MAGGFRVGGRFCGRRADGLRGRGEGEIQGVRWHDHVRNDDNVVVQGETGLRNRLNVQQKGNLPELDVDWADSGRVTV